MIVSPSGSLLRLKSSILEFSLLDCSLHFQDRAVPLENLRRTVLKKDSQDLATSETAGDSGPAPPAPLGDQMILVVSSERGAAGFSLPSQRQIHTYKSAECAAHHLQAQTVAWLGDKKANSVLLFFTSDGKVKGNQYQPRHLPITLNLLLFSSESAEIPAVAGGEPRATHECPSVQHSEILHRRSGHLLYKSKSGTRHNNGATTTLWK